jgi:hypothetical protein
MRRSAAAIKPGRSRRESLRVRAALVAVLVAITAGLLLLKLLKDSRGRPAAQTAPYRGIILLL